MKTKIVILLVMVAIAGSFGAIKIHKKSESNVLTKNQFSTESIIPSSDGLLSEAH